MASALRGASEKALLIVSPLLFGLKGKKIPAKLMIMTGFQKGYQY
ncbi:MAG: hypothetical protein ACI8O8_001243 [Oleiphilaceae bacterium]|jgi:hypothetical protein